MIYFIVTLRDHPCLEFAMTTCGAPALFVTRPKAEQAIEDMITRERQNQYCVQPVFVYSNFDKPVVRVFAPEGVRVEVVSHE